MVTNSVPELAVVVDLGFSGLFSSPGTNMVSRRVSGLEGVSISLGDDSGTGESTEEAEFSSGTPENSTSEISASGDGEDSTGALFLFLFSFIANMTQLRR